MPKNIRFEIQDLIEVLAQSSTPDGLRLRLSQEQWDTLASHLQPLTLGLGQMLIKQGAKDRTLYFVESGSLSVHYQDDEKKIHLAVVGPGTAVGEGAFFTHRPRQASVQAGAACKVWALSPLRFQELSIRKPQIALEITMGLGALVSTRLAHQQHRISVT